MKFNAKRLPLLLLFLGGWAMAQTTAMTFNLRYNNPDDKDNWWEHRKPEVAQLINYYHPTVMGIQEGLNNQITFLKDNLPDYDYIGVGRDDGKTKGEYAAVFYDTKKVKVLDHGTFWLSETPEKVSVGWDASMERICTWGKFQLLATNQTFYVFNCHFDHIGPVARKNSAKLVLEKIKEMGLENKPLLLTGDFNGTPDSEPIQIFSAALNDGLKVSETPLYGPKGTFNAFDISKTPENRIDYIFVQGLNVVKYRHIDDKRSNGLYISDHLPVFAQFEMK